MVYSMANMADDNPIFGARCVILKNKSRQHSNRNRELRILVYYLLVITSLLNEVSPLSLTSSMCMLDVTCVM